MMRSDSMERDHILVYKILLEIGFRSFEEVISYLEDENILSNLHTEPLNRKQLIEQLGLLLEISGFPITEENLAAAAEKAGFPIFDRYQSGNLSLAYTCRYLGRLERYGCNRYKAVTDSYDVLKRSIWTPIDNVRRNLYEVFQVPVTAIPLSSITKIENRVVYYKDINGEEIPLMNLDECIKNYAMYVQKHPDEYLDINTSAPIVADRCWNSYFAYFLFYTPSKVYLTCRIELTKWRKFLRKIGFHYPAANDYRRFCDFRKQMIELGYYTYDLT